MKLHNQILLGIVLGALLGGYLAWVRHGVEAAGGALPGWWTAGVWWLDLLGPVLFLGALKMILAPLILASIVAGVTSLKDVGELGAIGIKIMVYYMITTVVAVSIGIAVALIIQPGHKPASQRLRQMRAEQLEAARAEYTQQTGRSHAGADGRLTREYVRWLQKREAEAAGEDGSAAIERMARAREQTPGRMLRDNILRPILTNPFTSLSQNPPNALGIIFFAILLGAACTFVGKAASHVVAFFEGLNAVILKITHWVMAIAPLSVACIVAKTAAETGIDAFVSLGWYSLAVVAGIATHVAFLLSVGYFVGGVNPKRLWNGIREAWFVAFTTRSSGATLPVTIANATENLKVSPKVANFVLPIGATVNMDGTSLYQAVAIIFLIQVYGGLDDVHTTLNAVTIVLIMVTAVLASVGTAAVPSAGIIMLAIVATAVNVPFYYIPIILAVDPILDMFRTSTNILGDVVGSTVVHRLERHRLGD